MLKLSRLATGGEGRDPSLPKNPSRSQICELKGAVLEWCPGGIPPLLKTEQIAVVRKQLTWTFCPHPNHPVTFRMPIPR